MAKNSSKPTVVSSAKYQELLDKEQQLETALRQITRIKARFKLKEQRWREHQDWLKGKSFILDKLWSLLVTTQLDKWPTLAKSAFNILLRLDEPIARIVAKRLPKSTMITLEEIEKAVIVAVKNTVDEDAQLDDTLDKFRFDELDFLSLTMEIEELLEITIEENRVDFTKSLKTIASAIHGQLA